MTNKELFKKLILATLQIRLSLDRSEDDYVLLKLYLKKMAKIGKKITKNNPKFMRIKQGINIFCKSRTIRNKMMRFVTPAFVDTFIVEAHQAFFFKSEKEFIEKQWNANPRDYSQFINIGEESLEEYLATYDKFDNNKNKVK
jgi:hypothetical protein